MRRKIIAAILLCCFLTISITPKKVEATPLVIPILLKYAIGASLVAGGVYATNKESLDYAISDLYEKASAESKQQWKQIMLGAAAGYVVIDSVWDATQDYMKGKYTAGAQTVDGGTTLVNNPPIDTPRIKSIASGQYTYTYNHYGMAANGASGYITLLQNGQVYRSAKLNANVIYSFTGLRVLNDLSLAVNYTCTNAEGNNPGTSYFNIWQPVYVASTYTAAISVLHNFNNDLAIANPWANSNGQKKVAVPPLSGNTAYHPDGTTTDLTDEQLKKLLEDLLNVPKEDVINDVPEADTWWLDKDGNIIKTKPGEEPPQEEPNKPKPKKIISPTQLPEVPETPPDKEIVEETGPHEVTTETLPDGTTITKTTRTRRTTTTERDPDTGRTTKTTRKFKDITTTRTNPDGSTDTSKDTEELPDVTTITEDGSPDDTSINWEPLKVPLNAFTRKFPFSLPWDLLRSFQGIAEKASTFNPKWEIDVSDKLLGRSATGNNAFSFTIDLKMFKDFVRIVRSIELFLFDVGLIFLTRKLMGGDV